MDLSICFLTNRYAVGLRAEMTGLPLYPNKVRFLSKGKLSYMRNGLEKFADP